MDTTSTKCKQCGYWDALTDDGLCMMCAAERPEPPTNRKTQLARLKRDNETLVTQLLAEKARHQDTLDIFNDISRDNDALRAENAALKQRIEALETAAALLKDSHLPQWPDDAWVNITCEYNRGLCFVNGMELGQFKPLIALLTPEPQS